MTDMLYPTSPAAAKAGVATATIRQYANAGIVSPIRDANGRRLFTEQDIEKARRYRQTTTRVGGSTKAAA